MVSCARRRGRPGCVVESRRARRHQPVRLRGSADALTGGGAAGRGSRALQHPAGRAARARSHAVRHFLHLSPGVAVGPLRSPPRVGSLSARMGDRHGGLRFRCGIRAALSRDSGHSGRGGRSRPSGPVHDSGSLRGATPYYGQHRLLRVFGPRYVARLYARRHTDRGARAAAGLPARDPGAPGELAPRVRDGGRAGASFPASARDDALRATRADASRRPHAGGLRPHSLCQGASRHARPRVRIHRHLHVRFRQHFRLDAFCAHADLGTEPGASPRSRPSRAPWPRGC